jgi:hypothetical protein
MRRTIRRRRRELYMSEPSANPGGFVPQRKVQDYEDPHYHDDEGEVVLNDDVERASRPPSSRNKPRRPPPRRHYED